MWSDDNMMKYRVFYGVMMLLSVLFYLFFEGYLSFITLIFIFILPFVSLLCTVIARSCLHVQLNEVSPVASKGVHSQFFIEIQSTSIFPVAHAILMLECRNSLCSKGKKAVIHTSLAAHNSMKIKRNIISQYCGKLTVQLDRILIYDYLGIFVLPKKLNLLSDIYVLPLTIQLDTPIDSHTNYNVENSTYSKIKSGNDSSEIFDIRDYREGDRLRNIHWKLSSRLDKLMVKEFSLPLDNSVMILFDLITAENALIDTQIEAVVSISRFLLENQIYHSIEWYDGRSSKFDETVVEQSDDLAILLNHVLAASTYQNCPYALASHNTINNNHEYSHVIYVTTKLQGNELIEFCNNERIHKITILLVTRGGLTAEQKTLSDSLANMKISVLPVNPGKLRGSIDSLTL